MGRSTSVVDRAPDNDAIGSAGRFAGRFSVNGSGGGGYGSDVGGCDCTVRRLGSAHGYGGTGGW